MLVKELYESLGASYNEALGRLMNDILIVKFLKKFAESCNLNSLNEGYQNHDNVKVFEAAHSLKGVTGNLALTNLYNLASDICEKTRNIDNSTPINIDEVIKKINEEFNKTISLIKTL